MMPIKAMSVRILTMQKYFQNAGYTMLSAYHNAKRQRGAKTAYPCDAGIASEIPRHRHLALEKNDNKSSCRPSNNDCADSIDDVAMLSYRNVGYGVGGRHLCEAETCNVQQISGIFALQHQISLL